MSEQVAVAFADLVGYTAATEAHGDQLAATMSRRLSHLASSAMRPSTRLVKTIGDEVMIVGSSVGVVEAIRNLLAAVLGESDFPLLRVGADYGPVIEEEGDLYGATVNVAARIVDQADPMQMLVSMHTWESLGDAITGRSVGWRSLRNVSEEMELVELDLGFRSGGWWVDPICRMRVDRPSLTAVRDDVTFAFCSDACRDRFNQM